MEQANGITRGGTVDADPYVIRSEMHVVQLLRRTGEKVAASLRASGSIVDDQDYSDALSLRELVVSSSRRLDPQEQVIQPMGSLVLARQRRNANGMDTDEAEDSVDPLSISTSPEMIESGDMAFYNPYMCVSPFMIGVGDSGRSAVPDGSQHAMQVRQISATIIFNLALVEHSLHPSGTQTLGLYQLASVLCSESIEVDSFPSALNIALVNNIAVWCYDNGDQRGTAPCLDYLQRILRKNSRNQRSSNARVFLSALQVKQLNTNILWMLFPQVIASPAA
jgi:hypothetical protein